MERVERGEFLEFRTSIIWNFGRRVRYVSAVLLRRIAEHKFAFLCSYIFIWSFFNLYEAFLIFNIYASRYIFDRKINPIIYFACHECSVLSRVSISILFLSIIDPRIGSEFSPEEISVVFLPWIQVSARRPVWSPSPLSSVDLSGHGPEVSRL